jgi:hypothetical protein
LELAGCSKDARRNTEQADLAINQSHSRNL